MSEPLQLSRSAGLLNQLGGAQIPSCAPGKLKVLWLLADIAHGGIGTYTTNLFKSIVGRTVLPTAVVFYTCNPATTDFSLARALSQFTRVICTDERRVPEEVKHANPHIEFVPGSRIYDELLDQCDIVTTASNNPHVLTRTDWRGKPLLVQLHSTCSETARIAKRLRRYATHFLVTSLEAHTAATTLFGLPPDRVTMIESGVDANRLASWLPPLELRKAFLRDGDHCISSGFAERSHWLLYFGRFASEKRIPLIADAVRLLNESGQAWIGVFVGDGRNASNIKARIRQAIPHHHLLMPWVPSVGDIINASDVFICASDYEGGPISSLEALLAGIPVLSTDVGILPSVKLPRMPGDAEDVVYHSLGSTPTPRHIANVAGSVVRDKMPMTRSVADHCLAVQAAGRFSIRRMADDWNRVLRLVAAQREKI
ncbi:MAG: glycosyltransferase family 4 protein [Planctomycetota bacterium]